MALELSPLRRSDFFFCHPFLCFVHASAEVCICHHQTHQFYKKFVNLISAEHGDSFYCGMLWIACRRSIHEPHLQLLNEIFWQYSLNLKFAVLHIDSK